MSQRNANIPLNRYNDRKCGINKYIILYININIKRFYDSYNLTANF